MKRLKRKKEEEEFKKAMEEPVDSGIRALFKRKDFEQHLRGCFYLNLNSFLYITIDCNQFEFPAKVDLTPNNYNYEAVVTYNNDKYESDVKYRGGKFTIIPDYSIPIKNVKIKILVKKKQKFNFNIIFLMTGFFIRDERMQGTESY